MNAVSACVRAEPTPATIRVVSVPTGHVYVEHLEPTRPTGEVFRLPDPPVGAEVPLVQWWPPPSLQAGWVREHAGEFDLFHLHFGFDATPPEDLRELVRALRELGKPFVYTVHDLRNPHHAEPGLHDAQLEVLVPAADALITLTSGAAREIADRWGRSALVLAHPHVVPPALLARPRGAHDGFVVGVHVKSLRASMQPLPIIDALAEILPELAGGRLRVDAHTDVVTPGYQRFDPELSERLRTLARTGTLELAVHDCFSDDELWDYLQGLDLSVLPYRFGTHSGWLEACYDLGTPVLVSDCGYFTDQRPCLTYRTGPDGPDIETLEAGVRRVHAQWATGRSGWRADPAQRLRERDLLATEHRRVYGEVLAR